MSGLHTSGAEGTCAGEGAQRARGGKRSLQHTRAAAHARLVAERRLQALHHALHLRGQHIRRHACGGAKQARRRVRASRAACKYILAVPVCLPGHTSQAGRCAPPREEADCGLTGGVALRGRAHGGDHVQRPAAHVELCDVADGLGGHAWGRRGARRLRATASCTAAARRSHAAAGCRGHGGIRRWRTAHRRIRPLL